MRLESFSVYDHPKAVIFKREKQLTAEELQKIILSQEHIWSREELLKAEALIESEPKRNEEAPINDGARTGSID